MCGRYQRRSDKQTIAKAFGLADLDADVEAEPEIELALQPNYNVAPGTMQPVVVWDDDMGMRALRMMYWRFLPPFCTDPKKLKLDTIQANADRLLSSNVWRESFLYRRCLIPADTFVEWRKKDAKTKLPFLFGMKSGEPFGIGGIWQHWRSADRKTEFDTFAVVTVEPNEIVHDLAGHDRMPLVIQKKDYERWLRDGDVERPPVDLLRPFDADAMTAWRVGSALNNVRNNDASLMEPYVEEEPENGAQTGSGRTRRRKAEDAGQMPMFGT